MLTDIASGWTECAPLLFREQPLLGEVMTVVREGLPVPLLGFDTDNDTVFINETIKARVARRRAWRSRARGPIARTTRRTSSRKNGAIVRRMVGDLRLEGLAAAEALARLYRPMRLFVFFQPSFRLAEKRREGALVRKRHHPPLTPHQRLVADPRVPKALKDALDAQQAELDPVRLPGEIRAAQRALVEIADERPAGPRSAPNPPSRRSSPACAWPGRRESSARRRDPRRPSRAAGRFAIRSRRSPRTSRLGSRPTPASRVASCSTGCRRPTPRPIRTR